MKNCKLCRFSKVCNDLPGICIVLQYAAVAVLVGALGFLFFTQEVLAASASQGNEVITSPALAAESR
ncbi:MAG: hypothetical protein ABFR65_02390 [Pseudomonadota bacterium]